MNNFISVILATYNRNTGLKEVLESLLKQETQGRFDYEIIVVDNNSTDRTKEVIHSYIPKANARLKYFFEGRQGKSPALNKGILEAKGGIIAITDDDVLIDSRWLFSLWSCFERHQCDCIGGRVLPVFPDNTPQWIKDDPIRMAGVVVISDNGDQGKEFDKAMYSLIGANLAFKRSVIEECGLFRTDLGVGSGALGEDTEFVERAAKKGKRIYYCGTAVLRHPVDLRRLNLKNLAQWHTALGRSTVRCESDKERKAYVYFMGVPRYLIRGVMLNVFLLAISVFSRKALFHAFRKLFRKIGMISEYRAVYKRAQRGVNAKG